MSTATHAPSSAINYGNVQETVVDGIRDMILDGELRPDERLRQDDLADRFGVSTMPIREALRQLQAEGLVTFYPRQGARVARLSVSEYEEIFRIRRELESLACRWAVEHFERIPLAHLRLLLEEIEATEARFDDGQGRLQLAREFFFTIFEASEKEHLLRILSSLWDVSQHYRCHFSSLPEIVPQRVATYRKLYRACEARESEGLIEAFRDMWAVREPTRIPLLHEEQAQEQTK